MSSSPWPASAACGSARRSPRRRAGRLRCAAPPRPPVARPWRPARGERGREVLVEHELALHAEVGEVQRAALQRLEHPLRLESQRLGEGDRLGGALGHGQDPHVDRELQRVAVPAAPRRIVRCPTASKSGGSASSAVGARRQDHELALLGRQPGAEHRRVDQDGARLLRERHTLLDPLDPDRGGLPPDLPSARFARRATSSTASASASIVSTTSAPAAAAAGSSRTSTPSSRNGAALSGLRFQARTSWPARARLRAIGAPMTPVPSAAMVAMSAR